MGQSKTGIYGSSSIRLTFIVVSSASAAYVTWRLLQWRARLRARSAADNIEKVVRAGPMVDCSDDRVRMRVLTMALKRSAKWMQFQAPNVTDLGLATPSQSQVGGLGLGKRPMLTLAPEYALKPIFEDNRGFREIAFYEALKLATNSHPNSTAAAATALAAMRIRVDSDDSGPDSEQSETDSLSSFGSRGSLADSVSKIEAHVCANAAAAMVHCDTLAMWLAVFVKDTIVEQSEATFLSSWRQLGEEIEMLRRLSAFTTSYYGVLCPPEDAAVGNISNDSYLLLSDATRMFRQPCVMDLKMGTKSFEPDCTLEKRERHIAKYPQMASIGFLIVGMRVFDPSHPESDGLGFRTFDKYFGRSLKDLSKARAALELFFKHAEVVDAEKRLGEEAKRKNMDQYDLHQLKKKWKIGKSEGIRKRVVCNFLHQLNVIRKWFEDNKSLRFYSSSLLFVYEGDICVDNDDVTNLRMIDFCHVRRENGGDPGYLYGLQNLMKILTDMLRVEHERSGPG